MSSICAINYGEDAVTLLVSQGHNNLCQAYVETLPPFAVDNPVRCPGFKLLWSSYTYAILWANTSCTLTHKK